MHNHIANKHLAIHAVLLSIQFQLDSFIHTYMYIHTCTIFISYFVRKLYKQYIWQPKLGLSFIEVLQNAFHLCMCVCMYLRSYPAAIL